MANVLIAGCGYVGTALADALKPMHSVWAIRRRIAALPDGVNALALDLGQPFSLPHEIAFDWVFYTAAAAEFTPAAFRRIYAEGPRNLVDALVASGQRPRRLFYTSSTGVYAQTNGETVDERSPVEPRHFSGEAVLAGERAVLESGFAATVVRYAGIYGPGRASLVDELTAGRGSLTAEPLISNLIHRDDCVGVLLHLMAADPAPPVVVACDPHPADRNALIRWLAGAIGVDAGALPTANASPMAARGTKRCDSGWLQRSGYRFRYPSYREGYAAILDGGREP